MNIVLREGFKIRAPRRDENTKAAELFNLYDLYASGEKEFTPEVVSDRWQFPLFNLEEDCQIIVDENDQWISYIAVWNDNAPYVQNYIIVKTIPQYINSEVDSLLLMWAKEKAINNVSKAPLDAEVVMTCTLFDSQEKECNFVKSLGYSEIRYFLRLGIELENQIPKPQLAEGITIQTYKERKNLLEIVKCDRASFKDHWGYYECPLDEEFKEWEHWIKSEPYHDPSFWFLACSGDQVIGLSLCNNGTINDPNVAYLDSLCVTKEFRKKGIGTALLYHSFRELKKAGRSKVNLHVDAQSLTGATKLYESVGMKQNQIATSFQMTLRKGKSYRTEKI